MPIKEIEATVVRPAPEEYNPVPISPPTANPFVFVYKMDSNHLEKGCHGLCAVLLPMPMQIRGILVHSDVDAKIADAAVDLLCFECAALPHAAIH